MKMLNRDSDLEWQIQAACYGLDSELFYPEGKGSEQQVNDAKSVCKRCPVIMNCLEWALTLDDRFAILGGTTGDERREILRRRY